MNLFNQITRSLAAVTLLSSATAFAVQPLEISDVFVQEVEPHDLLLTRHDHLTVLGKNFMNGGVIELWLGDFDLEILSQLDTEIMAEMPTIIGAGSYQLVAMSGGGTVRHDDFDGVTIGIQGPIGDQGIQGEQGFPGTDGGVGPIGPAGPQGSKGDPGQPGAVGTNGQDGVDGSSCSASDTSTGALISCTNGISASLQDGADGADGLPGADGVPGGQGPAGQHGLACWDLNLNGIPDPEENTNGDEVVNVYDCKGDQVINLTVQIPDVPGLVAQDFVTIFPDAAKNTVSVEIQGICDGKGVVVNGPGFEIEVIPGFRQDGLPENQSGLSTELPLVLEFADDPADLFDCVDQIPVWLASNDPDNWRAMSIITRSPSGAEQVRWNILGVLPTSAQPGLDGRTRFELQVVNEISPTSNPNNVISIDRLSVQPFGFGDSFPDQQSLNLATDKAVEYQGGMFGYPAIEVEDPSAARLVLVYDAYEAGMVFSSTKDIATRGTAEILKRIVAVWSVDQNVVEISGTRTNYFGCFPMRWEQFTGFRQFASLKERVTLQCDFSQPAL